MDDARRCTAKSKQSGERCKRAAIIGGTVCKIHGGGAVQVAAAAHRRIAQEEAARSLRSVDIVPIVNPLEELALVAAEARAFQRHVADVIGRDVTDMVEYDEYNQRDILPALIPLYERALDRVGKLLADWVRLGFDERMVTLHERQAELVARMVRAVLDDPALGLTDVQRAAAPAVVRGHLRLLAEAA
jgi:hypothetical protein